MGCHRCTLLLAGEGRFAGEWARGVIEVLFTIGRIIKWGGGGL